MQRLAYRWARRRIQRQFRLESLEVRDLLTAVAADDSFGVDEDQVLSGNVLVDNGNGADSSNVAGRSLTVSTTLGTPPSHGDVTIAANGDFSYTPERDFWGSDLFRYSVSDGLGSDTGVVEITVRPVNDPPSPIDFEFTVDEDSGQLRIPVVTEEVLGTDNDADPTELVFVTAVGPAAGQVMFDNFIVYYTPTRDFSGTDTFTFTLTDTATATGATGLSSSANITINVRNINDRPIARDDNFRVNAGENLSGDVITDSGGGEDTDIDGDTLSVQTTPVTPPSKGNLTLNANGTFEYTPNANASGSDSFVYRVSDGSLADTATVNISINARPVAKDDNVFTDENQSLGGNVLVNNGNGADSDPDDTTLTVALVSGNGPANGQLTLNANGSFTYSPEAGFDGSDSFIYSVSDDEGASDTATVNISVRSANDPPEARDDTVSGEEDKVVAGNVIADNGNGADSDPNGDTLSIAATPSSGPSNGDLSLSANGDFTYTPTENFNGTDAFTYELRDGKGGSDTATVSIEVTPVNDAPAAKDDQFGVNETDTLSGNVLDNNGSGADLDPEGDALTVVKKSDPGNGSLALNADGSFTYQANSGFSGNDTFTYAASDGTLESPVATVTITVSSTVNQPPTAQDDSVVVAEDMELSGNVLADNGDGADSDPEGSNLTVSGPIEGPANGSVDLSSDGSFTYTPEEQFFGADSFTYSIRDPLGGTASATVNIVITPVSDAPVAQDDNFTVAFGGMLEGNVLDDNGNGPDEDPDRGGLTVTPTRVRPRLGTVTLNGDGSFEYVATEGVAGTDRFTYILRDADNDSTFATVLITIEPESAPTVVTVSKNDGRDIHDVLDSLSIQFSDDVASSLDAADLTLVGSDGTVMDTSAATVQWMAETRTARWDLSAIALEVDRYSVRLADGAIVGASGALDGDGDGEAGGSYENHVIVTWRGDTDFSFTVDFKDFLVLSRNFNSTVGTWSIGDFDDNGSVLFGDFLGLSNNFGKVIEVPPLPPPALPAIDAADNDSATDNALAEQEDWLL